MQNLDVCMRLGLHDKSFGNGTLKFLITPLRLHAEF